MRFYTGFNGVANGVTPGLQRLVDYTTFLTGNGLWNNGTFVNRPMRGKTSTSVHATGRAADISWRKMPNGKKGFGNYTKAVEFIDFLVANADELHIEAVFDYHPKPHGRGWRCDRGAWQTYDRPTISGAPGGDWFHIEIGPRVAGNPAHYDEVFKRLLGL